MVFDFNKKLGARIKELRLLRQFKQREVADMLEMERSNYTRIENGNQRPNDENLIKIAKIFDVEVKDLFDFEHKNRPDNLIEAINLILKENPNKIEDFYKIIKALTK